MSNPDWHYGRPERGDHIRVNRMGGFYSHHGIFISPDEVIHFSREDGASLSQVYVMKTDLKTFLAGGTLEVARYDDDEVYPVDDVVEYARSCVGESGYNLLFDNCEHIAAESKIGEHRSRQVERASTVAKFVLFGSSKKRPPAKSDQVKLAEIERAAQIEYLQVQTQARAEGQMKLADHLVALQEKLSKLAGQRLLVIASGKMEVVRDINKYYGEIIAKIEKRKTEYIETNLPKLLKNLAQYEEGTPSFNLYYRQIEKDQDTEAKFFAEQIDAVLKRQQTVLEQAGMSEQKIIEQTGETIKLLATGYMQSQVADALPSGTNSELKQLPGVDDMKKLSGTTHEIKRLPEPAAE
ncbi:MAG: lecithin retinol acyltransferase family protein [Selenomonadaceae bacterium]|nr:lecithin retinol acyltransferase family protein [Selenomonadaceae bacterium]